jgi:hypothetical protein
LRLEAVGENAPVSSIPKRRHCLNDPGGGPVLARKELYTTPRRVSNRLFEVEKGKYALR